MAFQIDRRTGVVESGPARWKTQRPLLLLAEVQAEVQGPLRGPPLSMRVSINLGHAAHPSRAVTKVEALSLKTRTCAQEEVSRARGGGWFPGCDCPSLTHRRRRRSRHYKALPAVPGVEEEPQDESCVNLIVLRVREVAVTAGLSLTFACCCSHVLYADRRRCLT